MKLRVSILLGILCLGFAGAAHSQSADDIIKRHIKASGGDKKLKAISSVRYEGTVAANGGAPRPFTWIARRPDRFYLELQTDGGPRIDAYNGRSGWREDPGGGLATVTGREQTRARANALFFNDRFQTYKKEKMKAGLAGNDAVNGRAAYVVEMTNPAGIRRQLFFDRENYALLRERHQRDEGEEEITFSDFRPEGGVPEPHRWTLRRGSDTFEITVTKITHNSPAEDAVFDFPHRAQTALPDIPALLKEVEKNQEAVEKIRDNYTYNMTETSIEVDGKGKLKEKFEKTYEIIHLGDGWTLQKLIAKDGQPLDAREQKKEQERVVKEIEDYEKWKKDAPKRQAKEEKQKAKRTAQGKGEEDDDDLELSDFMRIAQLTNPRRERFRGQEVLVFEFSPRPGYKPRNRSESLVQKLGGVVWIDEQARQVARLEARMLDDFRMGGGLVASLHRGSAAVFEQEMVKGEVWLPRYAEMNFSARVFLVAGFKINRILKFDHYQKFNVDSINEIKAPTQPPN